MSVEIAPIRRAAWSCISRGSPLRRGRLSTGGVAELIERLGFLQVDSISTVERAHHMILFARDRTYRLELLRRAPEVEVRLFEHWTYDVAAILAMRFYHYWRMRFQRARDVVERRFRPWHGRAHEDEHERVIDLIRHRQPGGERCRSPLPLGPELTQHNRHSS